MNKQVFSSEKAKKVSILGDSLSTLDGWNPAGYKLFYQGGNCEKSGVREYQDTWWGKLIDYLGGELLANNSWSGSRVTKLPDREQLFPATHNQSSYLHMKQHLTIQ